MRLLFTLLLLPLTTLALAQSKDSTHFRPKLYMSIGSFFPTISTTVRVDSDVAGIGSQISMEDNLKLDEERTTIRFDAYWDITKRSGVAATCFYLSRSSTVQLNQDVQFGDSTYHINQVVRPWFNTGFMSLAYRYSFFSHENWNAGLSAGVNWLQVAAGMELEGNKNYKTAVQFPAPTPFLGMHIQGNLTERLRARYDFRYFGLTIQGISGRVYDNKMMMEYYLLKHWGLGVAFNVIAYNIQEIPFQDNFDGVIRFNVNGFSLYVASRF